MELQPMLEAANAHLWIYRHVITDRDRYPTVRGAYQLRTAFLWLGAAVHGGARWVDAQASA
jgi:hypothetical protein